MRKLTMPEHISLRREFLQGMGGKELRQFAISALPGLLLALVAWLTLSEPGPRLIALGLGFAWVAACYAMTRRIDGDISMYAYIKRILRFYRQQKDYYYKEYRNEKR